MAKILKQYKVTLEKFDPEESIIGSYPDNIGLRTKLGGHPEWIQGDETPICPTCKKEMSFIGQIDSLEHQSKNNPYSIDALSPDQEYMFGDVGMIFVFLCFDCLETSSILQFY
ncbi:hypothetical protein A2716_05320 [candidate division WWE3 bacterium RIFCSPHIGHO2_01_FULL_40_23]|uniref:DUF1963 domain-containing protein n=1 Tax=candidate division WWE3 bacterium RIFCSPLOWO2_01_FULL_41_18 TaxID=1802625 RepID=A0A1F4VDP4_UNCKA|nr:MAG: hypothetical protein A2716_05320 [candidate division WWE3 bacterium RIFCSPHIGHO2_01_FULL_40_23]OGC55289.1 MAG: hypothetical protein A3A78_04930 [candidate division WWE3 bacterium RIFCSPLOWO2_01_FULL_41_18]